MATLAERDVLLEEANLGPLVINRMDEPGVMDDIAKMNMIWKEIFDKYPQEIDSKEYVKKINGLKNKYE